ncbi:MAG: hypothetical protein KDC85_09435 [Saprospiraceae bacterium]|nr:hypothetical protein [Saprospiraceae bacterium]MCB9322984.1 hypothetical protein [Lewinellaceae bacterium]
MLEIIAAVFLGKEIKKIVEAKGLKATKYIVIMVALWLGLEITGSVIGAMIYGEGGMLYLFALLGAALGAYISYTIAVNAPAAVNESNDVLDSEDILDAEL